MKKAVSLLLVLMLVLTLAGCKEQKNESKPINVYTLSGPTGIGIVHLKESSEANTTKGKYNINIVAQPDEAVAKLTNGEADIAAIATNLAAKLYNKTNGGITVLAVNTLGVLNVITPNGVEFTSFKDLKGKTVFTTGQGSNPEFIIKHLLKVYNIENDVKLEFSAEAGALATVWSTNPNAVIIAPQPAATTIKMNYEGAKIALNLTKEWEKVDKSSELMMGCIVVRNEFLNKNKSAVDLFLEEYKASVDKVNDIEKTAELCEKYSIIPMAQIAKAAIPDCNVCYIDGDKMENELKGYYKVLFDIEKTSVGGSLPKDDFYYAKKDK